MNLQTLSDALLWSAGTAILYLALAAGWARAQDAQRGQQIYENNCLTCHYERIHKRDPAKSLVKSQAQLRVEVAVRAGLVKQPLTAADQDDIAEYLNRTHYRFRK